MGKRLLKVNEMICQQKSFNSTISETSFQKSHISSLKKTFYLKTSVSRLKVNTFILIQIKDLNVFSVGRNLCLNLEFIPIARLLEQNSMFL